MTQHAPTTPDENPGLRRVVALLEREGFEVLEVDDGTHEEQGGAPGPYIALWSEPHMLVLDTLRLVVALGRAGINVACHSLEMGEEPNVEGRFNPIDDTAIIDLWNVSDRMLGPEPN